MKSSPQSPFSLSTEFLDERLYSFELKNLLAAEDAALENKYPDFKNLIGEYRDGILLFEVSNKEVWDKAGKDTTGLKEFFDKNKSNYKWDEPRYKGYIIHCKDQNTKKRILKETSKMNPDAAFAYTLQNYRVGEVSYVKIEKGMYAEGENPYIDEMIFKKGKAQPKEDFPEYLVIGKLLTIPEEYTDVRGLVITDYQNYLEEQWIKKLNEKYSVTIYQEVVNAIQ
jgi:peptidyl-prolyl cis-trans isomerase SurA